MASPLIALFDKYDYLISLDTETTGLNPQLNQIIELGVEVYRKEGHEVVLAESLNLLIKLPPGEKLPPEIIELTGITDADLQSIGVQPAEAARELYRLLTLKGAKGRNLFTAYNAAFDIGFVMAFLDKFLIDLNQLLLDYLDVLTIFKDRAQFPHRLFNAIAFYNLENEVVNSHRASDDAAGSFRVLGKMAEAENDINNYINLFGYNPKYGPNVTVRSVTLKPQKYNPSSKLYQE